MVDVGPFADQAPGTDHISCLWQGESKPIDIFHGGPSNSVLLVDIAVQLTLPAANGVATLNLPIPNEPSLVGGVLPLQALAIRPSGAAPRIPSSNGIELKFGLR